MTDVNESKQYGLESPPKFHAVITPHDTNLLAQTTRAIYVGVSGDVAVVIEGDGASGTPVVYKSVPIGYLIGKFIKVRVTATTATNMVAVW